jgi:hypothetical protein
MNKRHNHRSILLVHSLAIIAHFFVTSAAPAQELDKPTAGSLRAAIENLAAVMHTRHLSETKELEIQPFQCGRGINANAGVAIQKLLIEDLGKRKIAHKAGAKMVCRGEYVFLEEDKTVKILASILSSGGTPINFRPLEAKVSELEDLVTLTGSTGKFPVDNPAAREAAVVQNALETAVSLDAGKKQAAAAPQSPFAVEIHRLNKATNLYEPVPLESRDGQAFADLGPQDVYAIKLYNRSESLAAVNVTIDGLNLFAISQVPGYRQLGKLIIPNGPKGVEGFLLRGWHVNDQDSQLFEVAELPETLVAKVSGLDAAQRNTAAMGTITVSFFAAIPPDAPPPPDEPKIRSLGTKAGPLFQQVFQPTPVRIGVLREAVTIRYVRELPPPG